MQRSHRVLFVSAALALAACGSGASSASPSDTTSGSEATSASSAGDPSSEPASTTTTATSDEAADGAPADAPPADAHASSEHHGHHHHTPACGEVRVTFASGSAELDDAAHEHLAAYAQCLTTERTHVLFVTGSTDPVGNEDDNVHLAYARGRAVASYLQGLGCHMDFEIHAVGEAGADQSRVVWPEERAATVSETRPH
jgi:outer membrane protein OmpA-like peptidoglycan-associated protein